MLRFQNLATRKHLRISFMSGDVHATANSQFKSTKKIAPEQDPKFMLQSEHKASLPSLQDPHVDALPIAVISSAIVNTPPPPPVIWLVTKLGKKTHKVRATATVLVVCLRADFKCSQTLHHADTDEELIPLFTEDVSGRPFSRAKTCTDASLVLSRPTAPSRRARL